MDVIYRDWSHSCLQALGLWSPWSRPPLYGSVEHNIEHCWRRVWKLSSSIWSIIHTAKERVYLHMKTHWVHVWDHAGVKTGERASCVHTTMFLMRCFLFQQYLKPPEKRKMDVFAINKYYLSCAHMFSLHIITPKFKSAVTGSQSVRLPAFIPSPHWAKIRHAVTDQKTDCISFLAKSGGPTGMSWSPEGWECMTDKHRKRVMDSYCWKFLLGSFGLWRWHHVFTDSCDFSWNAFRWNGCCSNKQLQAHVWTKERRTCMHKHAGGTDIYHI